MSYYIVERCYTGPNADQHPDTHTYYVTTEPPRTNSSNALRLWGWLGTSNDWAEYAHGEYARQESAEDWIQTSLRAEGWREDDLAGDYSAEHEGIVARYRVGRLIPMSEADSQEWAYEAIRDEVQAETSDARLAALVAELREVCARDHGSALDTSAVLEAMQERRAALAEDV